MDDAGRAQEGTFVAEKVEVSTLPEPILIEQCNGQFVIFDLNVAQRLKTEYRMIAQPYGSCPNAKADATCRGIPYILMPEQVAVLMEYGYLKKTAVNCMDADPTDCEKFSQPDEPDALATDKMRERASLIAKGRKVKQLKRQSADGDCSSSVLKVRRSDLKDVEITDQEILSVLQELTESNKTKCKVGSVKIIRIPIYDTNQNSYEELMPSFPETSEFRIRLNTFRDIWRRGYYLTDGLKFGCDYLVYESEPGVVHSTWIVSCVNSLIHLDPLDLIHLSRLSSQVKKSVLLAIVAPDSLSPYYIEYSWWKPEAVSNDDAF